MNQWRESLDAIRSNEKRHSHVVHDQQLASQSQDDVPEKFVQGHAENGAIADAPDGQEAEWRTRMSRRTSHGGGHGIHQHDTHVPVQEADETHASNRLIIHSKERSVPVYSHEVTCGPDGCRVTPKKFVPMD